MSTLEIVTPETNETALRAQTRSIQDFKDPELQLMIDSMIESMREAEGVGLAAPQIGKSLKLAVVETLPEYDEEGEPIDGTRDLYVIANPKVIWKSRKKTVGVEGCLSIPGYLGEVERNYSVRVLAQDRNGRRKRYHLKGWDARIFQHEIDHLNGVLYTDKLTAPDKFWTEDEYEEYRKAQEEDGE